MALSAWASSGSRWAAKAKLGRSSSRPSRLRTRGRVIRIRRPPSVTSLGVVPARPAWRSGSRCQRGPHNSLRSCSIMASNTCWPARMHRSKYERSMPTNAPSSGRGISTVALAGGCTAWRWRDFLACFLMAVAPSWFGHPLRTTRRAKKPPLSTTSEDQQSLGHPPVDLGLCFMVALVGWLVGTVSVPGTRLLPRQYPGFFDFWCRAPGRGCSASVGGLGFSGPHSRRPLWPVAGPAASSFPVHLVDSKKKKGLSACIQSVRKNSRPWTGYVH